MSGRWSGGFQIEDAISYVVFDEELRETLGETSALMDGGDRLIEPTALLGGIKYTILERLVARGHLSYRDAYAAKWFFGDDTRLDMP